MICIFYPLISKRVKAKKKKLTQMKYFLAALVFGLIMKYKYALLICRAK